MTEYRPMALADLARFLIREPQDEVRWKLVWEFLEEHRWEPPDKQPALVARERDLPDLRLLADLAGIDSLSLAISCAQNFFPDEVMSERAQRVLAELFAA